MTELFCDGGVIGKNPSPLGGTWAWVLVANGQPQAHGSGLILPEDVGLPKITNNITEAYAAWRALSAMPKGWDGTLWTDSKVTLLRLTGSPKFDGIPTWFSERILAIRRNRKWKVELVKGHPSKADLDRGKDSGGRRVSKWNHWCDEECSRLAKEFLCSKATSSTTTT